MYRHYPAPPVLQPTLTILWDQLRCWLSNVPTKIKSVYLYRKLLCSRWLDQHSYLWGDRVKTTVWLEERERLVVDTADEQQAPYLVLRVIEHCRHQDKLTGKQWRTQRHLRDEPVKNKLEPRE